MGISPEPTKGSIFRQETEHFGPHFTTYPFCSFIRGSGGTPPAFTVWCVYARMPLRCPECSCSCLFAVSSTGGEAVLSTHHTRKQNARKVAEKGMVDYTVFSEPFGILRQILWVHEGCWRHWRYDQLNAPNGNRGWFVVLTSKIYLPSLDLQLRGYHLDVQNVEWLGDISSTLISQCWLGPATYLTTKKLSAMWTVGLRSYDHGITAYNYSAPMVYYT